MIILLISLPLTYEPKNLLDVLAMTFEASRLRPATSSFDHFPFWWVGSLAQNPSSLQFPIAVIPGSSLSLMPKFLPSISEWKKFRRHNTENSHSLKPPVTLVRIDGASSLIHLVGDMLLIQLDDSRFQWGKNLKETIPEMSPTQLQELPQQLLSSVPDVLNPTNYQAQYSKTRKQKPSCRQDDSKTTPS